jgi:hypothetical protein
MTKSSTVNALLSSKDTVLFTGSYNINEENAQGIVVTFPCGISINESGSNILSAESQSVNKKGEPKQKYLYETYTVASYDKHNKKIGQITWNGLYQDVDSKGNTTSNSVEKFALTSSDGIYKKVKSVIIKFNYPSRKIYFVGTKY